MYNSQSCGGRVRLARNMIGLTRKEINEHARISVNTLQSWESNKTKLTQNGAKRLNEAFARLGLLCSDVWLLTGKGQPPLLINECAQPPSEMTEDLCILRELDLFKSINPDPIAVVVSDNGMEPLYKLGDFVGGNKKRKDQISSIIGKNCIVETYHGETYVRKIIRGSNDNVFTLVCLNPYTDQQPVTTDVKLNYAANIVLHRMKDN